MDDSGEQVSTKSFGARWWITDRCGRVVVAQFPNPAIAVWLFSLVVGWTGLLDGKREDTLELVGSGALVVWALDELVRGSSPLRRLLGAVVLGFQTIRLFG
ncbi:MAG: hypothetical protein Q4P32_07810 [Micrococcales bacterium]|nr:hypothetical protein [Micrococcales bacterium]